MPVERKRGKLSNEELDFIDNNSLTMAVGDIAEKLNRSVEVIEKHIESISDRKQYTLQRKGDKEAAQDLRTKPFWAELKQQYTERELERYIYHWVGYLQQFNYDVTHSEESQICQAIDLMILMDRIKIDMKRVTEEIVLIEKKLYYEMSQDESIQDKAFIQSTMAQLQGYRAGQVTRSKELTDLLDKHSKLSRDLKTTRDQRFKELQDRKITFAGWIKMFNDSRQRELMSKDAELIRLAGEKSTAEFSEYHTYGDGGVDQPILSSETLKDDNRLQ